MAVVGVLVEAVVDHEHERVADLVAQVAQRDLHDAVGGVGLRAPVASLVAGMPKRMTPGTPSSASARTSLRRLSCVCCTTPGIDTTGSAASMPSLTNSGAMRSSMPSRCSATRRRSAGVRRSRRSRRSGNATSGCYGLLVDGRAPEGPEPFKPSMSAVTRPAIVWGSASTSTAQAALASGVAT